MWADEKKPDAFLGGNAKWERLKGDDEAQGELETQRLIHLGKIARRKNQAEFRAKLSEAYGNRCAVTGCSIRRVLEAAHIRVGTRVDYNQRDNGIFLRADLHALLDAGLITLAEDGTKIEVKNELLHDDSFYGALNGKSVFRPDYGGPSQKNIQHHRRRFGF
jgi:predicted restriction endonuclease